MSVKIGLVACLYILILSACSELNQQSTLGNFDYSDFKDSLRKEANGATYDTTNIFDANYFTPGVDSLDTLLLEMNGQWEKDMAMLDTLLEDSSHKPRSNQEEQTSIETNLLALENYVTRKKPEANVACQGAACEVYAEINKTSQTMYLYLGGELKDSFKVSTGVRGYETPNINRRPNGPIFTKYNSKKFPGGNYQGLGNMPYAVFVRGGYAIHGTTPGNFAKLGSRASHGCIRLHPENARIFYLLVQRAGLDQTWVTIKDR